MLAPSPVSIFHVVVIQWGNPYGRHACLTRGLRRVTDDLVATGLVQEEDFICINCRLSLLEEPGTGYPMNKGSITSS